jgi:GNAT superfamily N-acetyltransferase
VSAALTLRTAAAADAARVGEIYLASRKTAMPWLASPHTDEQTRWWHTFVLVPRQTVVVAERAGEVVGFADPTDGWLHALYITPSAQGTGVGSALLEYSMALQPGGFNLWVFARNTRALHFYARYGCVEVRRTDGADNEEHEPDVLLAWAPNR